MTFSVPFALTQLCEMPLCVCGPCWGDLGDILRLQEASGPNMIGLTDWQISPLWRCFKQRLPEGLRNAEGGLPCEHMALQYFGMHSHAKERLPSWTCMCTLMQGNIPAFRESQAQTLIHKQVQLAQADSHMGSVTHTVTPVNPPSTTHCTNTHGIHVLAFTLFSLHTRIYVWTLSCGSVAHTGTQTHSGTYNMINGVHTQRPTHAHSHMS